MSLVIRTADIADSAIVLALIKELAEFEGMGGEVTAVREDIDQSIFREKQADVLIAEYDGKPAAFALFYPVYSTFSGSQNLFLEDLFVREGYRGKGIGKALIERLIDVAKGRGAKRLDWYVLEENSAGAQFYRKLGAKPLLDRRTYRICL